MTKMFVIVIIMLVIFVMIVFWELQLEEQNQYYVCHNNMQDRGKADNLRCPGINAAKCKQCPYHKRFERMYD